MRFGEYEYRLIHATTYDQDEVKVYHCSYLGEYTVVLNGKKDYAYYTNDKSDAISTGRHMAIEAQRFRAKNLANR